MKKEKKVAPVLKIELEAVKKPMLSKEKESKKGMSKKEMMVLAMIEKRPLRKMSKKMC